MPRSPKNSSRRNCGSGFRDTLKRCDLIFNKRLLCFAIQIFWKTRTDCGWDTCTPSRSDEGHCICLIVGAIGSKFDRRIVLNEQRSVISLLKRRVKNALEFLFLTPKWSGVIERVAYRRDVRQALCQSRPGEFIGFRKMEARFMGAVG